MNYKILKLYFNSPLHVGDNRISDYNYTINADTIFSALCCELVKQRKEELMYQIIDEIKNGNLLFSNAFPFIDDDYFIPKPLIQVNSQDEDSIDKKAFKKLEYISIELLEDYILGEIDIIDEINMLDNLGNSNTHTKLNSQGDPYVVGSYIFNEKNGLYIICGYNNSQL
jgi:CRISPR-associated protein Csm4